MRAFCLRWRVGRSRSFFRKSSSWKSPSWESSCISWKNTKTVSFSKSSWTMPERTACWWRSISKRVSNLWIEEEGTGRVHPSEAVSSFRFSTICLSRALDVSLKYSLSSWSWRCLLGGKITSKRFSPLREEMNIKYQYRERWTNWSIYW